jgi:putative heme iron utilization protein
VVFANGDEPGETRLGAEPLSVECVVCRECPDGSVVLAQVTEWFGNIWTVRQDTDVLLKVRCRLPEIVDVRERLDDIPN